MFESLQTPGAETLLALGMALAVGLLLGAERQRVDDHVFGGIRTFPLYSLVGAVGSLLGTWVLVALTIAVGALLTVAYVRDSARRPEDLGMSTEVAAVVALALGALCTASALPLAFGERMLVVAAGATATLTLLALKSVLHQLAARISVDDVYATSKLLLLSVILLPLLPDADVGPFETLNPRQIGLLVVLVLGISFGGYVAVRVLGARRGLGLTGILGGLASSTAVTLVLSRRARDSPQLASACAVGIALASATMFPRLLAELYVVAPAVAAPSTLSLLAAGGVALLGATVLYVKLSRRTIREDPPATGESTEDELALRNPLSLRRALEFGVLFAIVLVITGGASRLSATGAHAAAALAGLLDADAVALSLARVHELGHLHREVALDGIAIGAAANTVGKVGLAALIGGRRVAVPLGLVLAPALVVLLAIALSA